MTLSLLDLRQHRDELSADDRASADRLLTRPTTSTSKCFTLVCVHWSTTGTGKATSAYAAQVASVAEHVLETDDAAGYRAPEVDGLRGGNGLLDIYLHDVGGRGLYGYCDSGSTTWRARRTASSAPATAPPATSGCAWTCPPPGAGQGRSSRSTGPPGTRRPPR